MPKHDQHSVMVKNLCMRDKRDTPREREREAQRINYIEEGNSYKLQQQQQPLERLQGHFIW